MAYTSSRWRGFGRRRNELSYLSARSHMPPLGDGARQRGSRLTAAAPLLRWRCDAGQRRGCRPARARDCRRPAGAASSDACAACACAPPARRGTPLPALAPGPASKRSAGDGPLRRPGHQPPAGVGRCGRYRPRSQAAPGGGAAVSARLAQRLQAEVCVIGSGAGGAPVAAELAEGGVRVALLEEGAWHDPDHFTARSPEMLARLYREGGQTFTLGRPPIMLPLGRGIGGTTLINSGTCFRTPAHVLARWQREYGIEVSEDSLRPCFERVEEAISVDTVTPELAGGNAAVVRRGAERLRWSYGYLRRNARGCVGSGVCTLGCPTSAKQHTGITYIPRAQRAGAQILTGAQAKRVLIERGRAAGVLARLEGGATLEVRAPTVVVAAGTINTPLLLKRSGLAGRSGQLGRNLSLHPATAVFARMDEIVDMARGVPQSLYIDHFAEQGIMLEGSAGPPAYAALALPLTGARHAEAMRAFRQLAVFGLMVSDSSRGSVAALGSRPLIRYDMNAADLQRFRDGLV